MLRFKFYLSAAIFFYALSLNASSEVTPTVTEDITTIEIKAFLSTLDCNKGKDPASIFIDLLVKENGEIYTIDFMVTEEGNIIVLSKEVEEEYYKIQSFSTKKLKQYALPVALIENV